MAVSLGTLSLLDLSTMSMSDFADGLHAKRRVVCLFKVFFGKNAFNAISRRRRMIST